MLFVNSFRLKHLQNKLHMNATGFKPMRNSNSDMHSTVRHSNMILLKVDIKSLSSCALLYFSPSNNIGHVNIYITSYNHNKHLSVIKPALCCRRVTRRKEEKGENKLT